MLMVPMWAEQAAELSARGVVVTCSQCARALTVGAPTGMAHCPLVGDTVYLDRDRLCTGFEERH